MKNDLSKEFQELLDNTVSIEVSGGHHHAGVLVDLGPDIFVLFNGMEYLYIPSIHVHNIRKITELAEEPIVAPAEVPIDHHTDKISFRKTLINAKGLFVKIYVTGNKTLHGYITSVMNDYFVFYSPVYKTMYITLSHLKWLIPYKDNVTPYTLSVTSLPISHSSLPLARTFDEQCKKLENQMIVLDLGDHLQKTGLLKKVFEHKLALTNADGETVFWNLHHLKIIYAI
ncbi:DUF2642 domain-containing protein [Fictibacillus sp. WQ 8-8]|uniref:DUF2642 domain-containing protein n=1 Tax=Fictibacillus sp. WQ 8-8 TaxID=2938788 RepID=UPI00210E81D6|nr:DUF2642 domain-containing protein [Fictibacillus sp. WQ 8-8]MCQ6265247.1 DUF2642 domain-containing protein [Fictibacillus sp. WQ 8-8]